MHYKFEYTQSLQSDGTWSSLSTCIIQIDESKNITSITHNGQTLSQPYPQKIRVINPKDDNDKESVYWLYIAVDKLYTVKYSTWTKSAAVAMLFDTAQKRDTKQKGLEIKNGYDSEEYYEMLAIKKALKKHIAEERLREARSRLAPKDLLTIDEINDTLVRSADTAQITTLIDDFDKPRQDIINFF